MKKISLIIAVFFISLMVVSAFAQAKQGKKSAVVLETTIGTVTSVDKVKKEIVIKDDKTGQDKVFTVSEKQASSIKVGENVKVKAKAGSSAAETVRAVNPGSKNK
ncbi:MAG: hypothetical protein MUF05_00735 [Candidatus Omnitrophica bacterium]|jgi:hypothetical protein|nr:hypothetical protein [Candidatus Omnitrophota bacterium]